MYFIDYCRLSGMEGFNCASEALCVPQDYVCDGIPDCVQASVVFDEMNCPPTPSKSINSFWSYNIYYCNVYAQMVVLMVRCVVPFLVVYQRVRD